MKRKLIFIVLCSLIFSTLSAQNIKGKYISRMLEDDMVTFILPQGGYDSKQISSKLVYDITHSSAIDSVTFNFSYTSKTPMPVDSVTFFNDEVRCTYPAKMFFIDPKKGDKWENRVSVKMKESEFRNIRSQQKSCNILIHTRAKDNKPVEEYKFEIAQKNWTKNIAIVNKIFEVVEYSN